MGDSEVPVSKPIAFRPFFAWRVTSHKWLILSGSAAMISRAARTLAADAGVILALKMSDRELCFR